MENTDKTTEKPCTIHNVVCCGVLEKMNLGWMKLEDGTKCIDIFLYSCFNINLLLNRFSSKKGVINIFSHQLKPLNPSLKYSQTHEISNCSIDTIFEGNG